MSEYIYKTKINSALCMQINRPEKKNALTAEMYADIAAGIKAADSDPDIRSIILHGQEGLFTSGNDLAAFQREPSPNQTYPHNSFIEALRGAPKPVIAVVDGICLGIGTIILFHCDFVYAAPGSRFSLPFVNLGLSPEGGTSYILARLGGYQRAAEIILLGEPFTVEVAEKIGLINEIVSSADLMERAFKTADKLAERSLESIIASKALMRETTNYNLSMALDREQKEFSKRMAAPDVRHTIARFFSGQQENVTK